MKYERERAELGRQRRQAVALIPAVARAVAINAKATGSAEVRVALPEAAARYLPRFSSLGEGDDVRVEPGGS
jgi:hypothetical protein